MYLFTKGFLLTRLSLEETTSCSPLDPSCSLPAQFDKAVVVIIDALRFDFVAPASALPVARSEHFHGVLTVPAELSAAYPGQSLIFNAHADPPTTTLQRLKGITTGSLPTFIDMGSNFAGSAIDEDSWIHQARAAGKRIGFVGDETWLSVYPASFGANMSFPFDSFNVEDLHSVDNGVTKHLPALMAGAHGEWDILVGHFLGVDHVGHRLGPSHAIMTAKLAQMDAFLRQTVAALDERTVLVVMGDHGMDRKGDHGGEGVLETSSALWVYTKQADAFRSDVPAALQEHATFPGAALNSARAVQQIDLVPTLSLLLGLPVPFNNLGSVIPELFATESLLARGMKLNAAQIWTYLERYGTSTAGGALSRAMGSLKGKHASLRSLEAKAGWAGHDAAVAPSIELLKAYRSFTRAALQQCRTIWAQFDLLSMLGGLAILLLSLLTAWVVYMEVARHRSGWETWVQRNLGYAVIGSVGGVIVGTLGPVMNGVVGRESSVTLLDSIVWYAAFVSQLAVLLPNFVDTATALKTRLLYGRSRGLAALAGPALLGLHVIGLSTNSFILWEDRISLYFLSTALILALCQAPGAPSAPLRIRIIGFSALALVCFRLTAISTICREETSADCSVTFYEGATVPVSPAIVQLLALPLASMFPVVLSLFLGISKSYAGMAPFVLGRALRVVLLAGTLYWVLDRAETWRGLNPDRIPLVKLIKVWLARATLLAAVGGLSACWYASPPCIEVRRAGEEEEKERLADPENDNPLAPPKPAKGQIVVLGFANSYGASYLLFLLPLFATLWLLAQPSGQFVLALTFVGLLAYLEVVDSQRDAIALRAAFAASTSDPAGFDPAAAMSTIVPPSFTETSILALVGSLVFYTTGHQAVLTSFQWGSAFIGFPTLTYPFSPILVVLNTLGPLAFVALFVPLLGSWNVSPIVRNHVPVLPDALKAVLGFGLYQAAVTVATAAWAGVHRRHLMVWKVFAPRFMLAGCALLLVDLTLIVAVAVGLRGVHSKVARSFKTIA